MELYAEDLLNNIMTTTFGLQNHQALINQWIKNIKNKFGILKNFCKRSRGAELSSCIICDAKRNLAINVFRKLIKYLIRDYVPQ